MTIREGNTGILYLNENSNNYKIYIPDYNLEDADNDLLKFMHLKNYDGNLLKENYTLDKINYFAAQHTYLFWSVFFPLIKYRKILLEIINSGVKPVFKNNCTFYSLYSILVPEKSSLKSRIKKKVYNYLISISNRRVIKKYKPDLLLFTFSPEDFRARDIVKEINKLTKSYVKVIYSTSPHWKKTLINKLPYYFIGINETGNQFNISYDLSDYPEEERGLILKIINYMERRISSYINETKVHYKNISSHKPGILYGFDEADHIMPLLYAVKKLGIKNIAHQHGAYVKRHFGYIKNGFSRDEFIWWDKIIVWGDYWKDQLLNYSNIYEKKDFIIGCNKLNMNHSQLNGFKSPDIKRLNILIPYEFLANTFQIGKYINKLLSLGHNVYFKPRSDESVESQLESYNINPDEKEKIIIVNTLDEDTIRNIDIIAGTMTTLIYELMPYSKIIWYLDTDYKHLYDLVEQGYAHHIKYEDIDNITAEMLTPTIISKNYFFNDSELKEVISKYVLN